MSADPSKSGDKTLSSGDISNPENSIIPEDPKNSLPGAEQYPGRINWMGSSYSGADIKVVAHLYGEVDQSTAESYLVRERDFAQDMIEIFTSIKSQLSYTFKLDDALVNADSADAVRAVEVFFASFSGLANPDTRITLMYSAAEANLSFYQSYLTEITEKLQDTSELRKESSSTVVLATLQTMSIQSHREKVPVRAFGSSHVKGFTRGGRVIAGSMIFTMFNEHALAELMRRMASSTYKYGDNLMNIAESSVSSLLADQLPPLDLTIVFANEYGSLSRATLYGVEFMSDSMTLSIEDLLTEDVISFVARDVDPIMSEGHISLMKKTRGMHYNRDGTLDDTATGLMFTSMNSYTQYLEKLKVRRRLKNR